MVEHKAARPCIAFGAAPDVCQNHGPGRLQPGWDLRSDAGDPQWKTQLRSISASSSRFPIDAGKVSVGW
jgi:hypothetical protein